MRKRFFWAFLAYVILSLIFTYPLALNFATHVPGDGRDDPALVWNLWWMRHSLLDLGISPLTTDYMFYPVGINLTFFTLTILNGFLSFPLQPLMGLVATANVILIFSFALSGFGAYLLAMYVLGWRRGAGAPPSCANQAAAFLAGLIYAFGPAKLLYASLGQFNMTSTEWMPFFVLYLFRLARPLIGSSLAEKARLGSGNRPAVLAGLYLALTGLSEFTLASFLVLFAVVYILYLFLTDRRRALNPALWQRLTVLGGTFVLLFSPILWAMFKEIRVEGDYMLAGWGFADVFSADVLGFFIPSHLHPVFGAWAAAVTSRFSYTNFVTIGFIPLALAAIAAARLRKIPMVGFWLSALGVFVILSLGPLLHIGGTSVFDLDGLPVRLPLPFIILHYVPFIKGNRYPARFQVLTLLALAILAAYSLQYIRAKIGHLRPWPTIVSLALGVTLGFEYLAVPLPLSDFRVPEIYQVIGKEPGSEPILQLPLSWRNSFSFIPNRFTELPASTNTVVMFQQYYQAAHQRRSLSGNTSRNPEFKFDYFIRAPVIRSLIDLEEGRPVSAAQLEADRSMAKEVLRFFGFRYVVIHPPLTGTAVEEYVRSMFPVHEFYRKDGIVGYRVGAFLPPASTQIDLGGDLSLLYTAEGWGGVERAPEGYCFRWLERPEARMFLPVGSPGAQVLGFRARAATPNQRLEVRWNGQLAGSLGISERWDNYQIRVPGAAAREGLNELVFHTTPMAPITTVRAPDMPVGKTGVPSPVSIAVRSAGLEAGNYAHIYVDGKDYSTNRKGYNLVVVDPRTGRVENQAFFDTSSPSRHPRESIRLMDFIKGISPGKIVAAAIADDASLSLEQGAVDALGGIGAQASLRGRLRWGHAVIGVKGARPGQALEDVSLAVPAQVHVGVNVTSAHLGVAISTVTLAGASQ
ncbi:MAG: interleukin-like EMT inducer domain-containing protein [Chloroflexota bacterium]